MSREQMIEELIEHDIDMNFSDTSYIAELLFEGSVIRGYSTMSDDEIKELWDSIQ